MDAKKDTKMERLAETFQCYGGLLLVVVLVIAVLLFRLASLLFVATLACLDFLKRGGGTLKNSLTNGTKKYK